LAKQISAKNNLEIWSKRNKGIIKTKNKKDRRSSIVDGRLFSFRTRAGRRKR